MDIRQSPLYAKFMVSLGWKAVKIFNSKLRLKNYCYVYKFPIFGSFIKILHPGPDISFSEIEKIVKAHHGLKVDLELDCTGTDIEKEIKSRRYLRNNSPLLPTRTILIDLRQKIETIFQSFSSQKRRAVRRAMKNKLIIKNSFNIDGFIGLKNRQLWPFGFLLNREIVALWKIFSLHKKAKLLLAYDQDESKVLGGVLLLFWDKMAYYWLASASPEGKKLFVPSFLVWEALKLSKKNKAVIFNFEGVEDERFSTTKNWRGFSRFKSGFGGKIVEYPLPVYKLFFPWE